jgi:hypothetical protein
MRRFKRVPGHLPEKILDEYMRVTVTDKSTHDIVEGREYTKSDQLIDELELERTVSR